MKSYSGIWSLLAAVCLLSVCSPAQEQGMELSVFRVPEYDDQGNMTAQLFGRHAEVGLSGEVKIEKMRIEFYQAGATYVTVESPLCFYNAQKRAAHSDSEVSAVAEKIKATGRGFEWDPATHSIRVFNDVHVVLENTAGLKSSLLSSGLTNSIVSGGAVSTATGGVVTVTSKELLLDYIAKIVQFEKGVNVTSSDGTEMHCEKLKIPLNEGRTAGVLKLPGMTEPDAE